VNAAVVLMAYGSPETADDIRPYLEDIREGRPVSDRAVAELTERYRRIGGRSPLAEITERQRAVLQAELELPVYVGMKHWRPRIAEAADSAVAHGADMIVGLVLAPHYSALSIGGYRERLEPALADRADLLFVESWHDHGPFLDVLADRVQDRDKRPSPGTVPAQRRGSPSSAEVPSRRRHGAPVGTVPMRRRDSPSRGKVSAEEGQRHVVFTAHSLPERILAAGDPYRDQLLETSRLVADRAGLERWSFAFQSASRTGEPWLGPDILEELESLHARGVSEVLAAPVGFVSDHLEILWDLDVEAREKAADLGLGFSRIDSLNDDPSFIAALADVIRQTLEVRSKA
jgi:protoporphyrin/coproporphyrin ferrochelatase